MLPHACEWNASFLLISNRWNWIRKKLWFVHSLRSMWSCVWQWKSMLRSMNFPYYDFHGTPRAIYARTHTITDELGSVRILLSATRNDETSMHVRVLAHIDCKSTLACSCILCKWLFSPYRFTSFLSWSQIRSPRETLTQANRRRTSSRLELILFLSRPSTYLFTEVGFFSFSLSSVPRLVGDSTRKNGFNQNK